MIILSGHNKYGKNLLDSAEMIGGKQKNIYTVDFTEDMSVKDIYNSYENIAEDTDEDILILSDIPGGSPANAALLYKNQHKQVRVFTGLNLTMLLSLIMGESVSSSIESAINSIKEL
ncbi:PTS mannose/fructose/sorbose family IIA subunit [Tetragenococcus osmophilus]|uniref:PTS N-acetylgalactosamine IIA component n=1 Tax=Tetragenococcus osmophilus TaxID=526944 RepID=A0AA37XNQ8_9ENTE|nr:PTS sugar transporter subunit IIA [Tetragenococcus osmophilus]AYW47271.1 PTS mannose/fructose/sorbose family IIA subunit [Tetragenococcus osmophilus]GMA73204.1 PTS N-acetylgalactosamine IIA component [Tetragenococcus osmophilus]